MTHRVLVVDDDPQILRTLRINLTAHGYHVLLAPDGAAALRAATDELPDVIVLDLGLPDMDGTDVITGLRGWTSTPIIVLTARTGAAETVKALDTGADDYVTKPFGMPELLARLRAAVRRAGPPVDGGTRVDAGDFIVDLAAKKVIRADGTEVHLTPTEWGVLELLVRHRGKLVGQRELLRAVWGPNYGRRPTTCASTSPSCAASWSGSPARPKHLITEAGMGYRFEL